MAFRHLEGVAAFRCPPRAVAGVVVRDVGRVLVVADLVLERPRDRAPASVRPPVAAIAAVRASASERRAFVRRRAVPVRPSASLRGRSSGSPSTAAAAMAPAIARRRGGPISSTTHIARKGRPARAPRRDRSDRGSSTGESAPAPGEGECRRARDAADRGGVASRLAARGRCSLRGRCSDCGRDLRVTPRSVRPANFAKASTRDVQEHTLDPCGAASRRRRGFFFGYRPGRDRGGGRLPADGGGRESVAVQSSRSSGSGVSGSVRPDVAPLPMATSGWALSVYVAQPPTSKMPCGSDRCGARRDAAPRRVVRWRRLGQPMSSRDGKVPAPEKYLGYAS